MGLSDDLRRQTEAGTLDAARLPASVLRYDSGGSLTFSGSIGDNNDSWSISGGENGDGSGYLASGGIEWDHIGNFLFSGNLGSIFDAWAINDDGSGYLAQGHISCDSNGLTNVYAASIANTLYVNGESLMDGGNI